MICEFCQHEFPEELGRYGCPNCLGEGENTMNSQRRKDIAAVLNELADLRSRIETIQSDEQDAYDNLPEGIRDSERGQKAEEACSRLDDAVTAFDDLESALNDAQE
jgi:hypothetical protein